MSQQINLLNTALIKKKNVLTTANIAVAFSFLMVVLVTFTLIEVNELKGTKQKLVKTTKELSEVQGLLAQLRGDTSELKEKERVLKQITFLENKEAMQEAILDAAKHDQSHQGESYAALLKAFARQSMDGLWITALNIDQDAKHLSISGRTTNPDLVPTYLNRLRNESVLHGKSFTDLTMQYHQEAKNKVNTTQKVSKKDSGTKAMVEPGFDKPKTYIEFTLRSVPDTDETQSLMDNNPKVVGVK